jgi:hypothetical protein
MSDMKEVRVGVKHRKAGVHRRVATLLIAAGILSACSSSGDDTQAGATGVQPPSVEASVTPVSPSEKPGPEIHTVTVLGDPALDGSYVITMKLLDGYNGDDDVVFGSDGGQGISTWAVGNVFGNPCHSNGTLLDPPIDSSVHGLVAGLASQKGHPATTPTDVEIDGYAGEYMEMTVPAGIHEADCDHGEFRTWADPYGCCRNLEAGQRDLLWIVDVDGARLVIDAALGPQTTQQDRADRIHMVRSIQIDPV